MGNAHSAGTRTALGVVGNVISAGLFLSPIRTFYTIYKKKDVESFDATPYLSAVMNCLLWCFYGMPFVNPNSLLVVTINGAGLIIELVYLFIFCCYASKKGKKLVAGCLSAELVAFGVFVLGITMGIPVHKMFVDRRMRVFIVGIICDIFNVLMYMSPLFIVKEVIKTKSVKYMTPWLSLCNTLNGACWASYALIGKIDYYILLSNGLGFILGASQLIIYGKYYRNSKTAPEVEELDDDNKKQLPAIEMQPAEDMV